MNAITPIPWDGQKIGKPGCFSDVPMLSYHGPALCVGPSISSSGLRTIFSDSPMAYWIESPINENRVEPKDKAAFVLGRGAHHLFLGEADFYKHFIVRPVEYAGKAWNSNRLDCQAWLGEQALAGLTVLTPGDIEHIRGMGGLLPWQKGLVDSGLQNSAIVIDNGLLGGLIEQSIVWQDGETGVWLKARPDAIPSDSGMFADLKTTTDVHYDALSRTIAERRYDMQAALVARGAREVLGLEMQGFLLIFVMKTPPYSVQLVELKRHDIEAADQDIRTALRTFARCLDTGRWPGPGGTQADAVSIGIHPKSRERADARRAFLEQEIIAA